MVLLISYLYTLDCFNIKTVVLRMLYMYCELGYFFSAAEFVSLALKGLFVSCSRLSVLVFVFNYYLYLHIAISHTRVEKTKKRK